MISRIVKQLYISDWSDAQSLLYANPESITAVLNVCEEEDNFTSLPWMKYFHCAFEDHKPIPREKFDACMSWLNERYRLQNNILIHCALGVSRSPTICAAFLTKQKIVSSMDEGIKLVKLSRPIINPAEFTFISACAFVKVS